MSAATYQLALAVMFVAFLLATVFVGWLLWRDVQPSDPESEPEEKP